MNNATPPDAPPPDATPPSVPIETVHEIRDQCLCFAAQRAARRLARRFDRLFQDIDLTNGQFSLMVSLMGKIQPRLGELADFLAMDQATLSAGVKTLERRSLLTLVADDDDGRVRRAVLTSAGRALVAKAVPLWRAEHAKLQAEQPQIDARALALLMAGLG